MCEGSSSGMSGIFTPGDLVELGAEIFRATDAPNTPLEKRSPPPVPPAVLAPAANLFALPGISSGGACCATSAKSPPGSQGWGDRANRNPRADPDSDFDARNDPRNRSGELACFRC